jgi:Fur family transcriptional regulator, ferric uptake regulator
MPARDAAGQTQVATPFRVRAQATHRSAAARHATLAARLRAAGQRVTPQRLLILGVFRPGEHLSADEVFDRVERELPATTRSTVYRSLESFRDAGLVSETDLGHGVRQFELLEEARHHHLICHGCGAMVDLADELVQPLRDGVRARYGFAAGIEHLALFGYCAACQPPEAAGGRGQAAGEP